MTDHRSPEEIERQLEQERAGLAEDLDDLREKFSIDTIVRQTAEQIRAHSGDIGASVSRAVKENPLAVAVTGVGLAWMIFGDRSGATSTRHRDHDDPYVARSRRYTGQGAPASATGAVRGYGGQDHDLPAWARSVDHSYHGADDDSGHGPSAKERLTGVSVAARDKLHETATSVQDRAKALRERLSHGTEHLTEEGRARVLAAREKAHHAREVAMTRMTEGRDKAVDLFEEQPLIAGALALALGAAIGAALPHTRFEDEHFGETSDELIREAERIFTEERAKLGSTLEKAADDAANAHAEKPRRSAETASGADSRLGQGGRSADTADRGSFGNAQGTAGKGPAGDIPS